MTIFVVSTQKEYLCDSSDVKPASGVPPGAIMYETDTGLSYIFSGGVWTEKKDPMAWVFNDLWKDMRLYYSAGDLIYKCCNTVHKASTASETWYIWKYTWVGTDLTRTEGPLIGSVDNRTGLSWG